MRSGFRVVGRPCRYSGSCKRCPLRPWSLVLATGWVSRARKSSLVLTASCYVTHPPSALPHTHESSLSSRDTRRPVDVKFSDLDHGVRRGSVGSVDVAWAACARCWTASAAGSPNTAGLALTRCAGPRRRRPRARPRSLRMPLVRRRLLATRTVRRGGRGEDRAELGCRDDHRVQLERGLRQLVRIAQCCSRG